MRCQVKGCNSYLEMGEHVHVFGYRKCHCAIDVPKKGKQGIGIGQPGLQRHHNIPFGIKKVLVYLLMHLNQREVFNVSAQAI